MPDPTATRRPERRRRRGRGGAAGGDVRRPARVRDPRRRRHRRSPPAASSSAWAEAGRGMLAAADAAAGEPVTHAHVGTEDGEAFAVRHEGFALVAAAERFALAGADGVRHARGAARPRSRPGARRRRGGRLMPPKPHRVLLDRVSGYADEASAFLRRRRLTRLPVRPRPRARRPGPRLPAGDRGRPRALPRRLARDRRRGLSSAQPPSGCQSGKPSANCELDHAGAGLAPSARISHRSGNSRARRGRRRRRSGCRAARTPGRCRRTGRW